MSKDLRFGTGGVPLSAVSRSTLDGLVKLRELGLDHMELEFVHGVRIKEEMAKEIGDLAGDLDISLTIHAPYYVNLNSVDPKIRAASRERILDSCRIGAIARAKSVCFHSAFNMGQDLTQVFDNVLTEMLKIEEQMEREGLTGIFLAPETMGKHSQFGDLEELLALTGELKHTRVCLDFAHLFARSAGEKNSYSVFLEYLNNIDEKIGKAALNNLHIHISGIEYSIKGEKKHLELEKSGLNWRKVLKALKDRKVGGYVVCESPNLEKDALQMKEYYESIH